MVGTCDCINPLNAELNPIRHLLALVGARHIVHVSRVSVNGPSGSVICGEILDKVRTGQLLRKDSTVWS